MKPFKSQSEAIEIEYMELKEATSIHGTRMAGDKTIADHKQFGIKMFLLGDVIRIELQDKVAYMHLDCAKIVVVKNGA